MCKVCLQRIFSESVSPQTLCASCNHVILARDQIIQAARRIRSSLFSAEKFDVIKLRQLVNQAATIILPVFDQCIVGFLILSCELTSVGKANLDFRPSFTAVGQHCFSADNLFLRIPIGASWRPHRHPFFQVEFRSDFLHRQIPSVRA